MPLLALGFLTAPVRALEISELLADNQGGLQDSDGQSPGWIELHNPGAVPVDLEGWHLTDDPLQPTRWTFPAVSIPAGGYLVVFASGKDRAVAGQPLHANFRLSTDGEWAILNRPGGQPEPGASIQFPALRRNISFSVEKETSLATPLIPAGSGARFLVPEDGLASMDWTQPNFDDSSWLTGAMPMGFGGGAGGAAAPVLRVDFNDRDADPNTTTQSGFTPFVVGNTGGNAAVQSGPITRVIDGLEVTLSHTGADGYDDRLRTTPTDSATLTTQGLLRDFVFSRDASGTSGLDITIPGLPPGQPCRVTVWSYDNTSSGNRVSDWWANGVQVKENYTFNGTNLPVTDSDALFSFETVTPANGPLVIGGRRDTSSSTFGVFLNAIEIVPLGYGSLIATDLAAEMPPPRSSVYMRIPFVVPDPSACEVLRLKARYDDGFVVWLNGKPLLRRNAPENQQWDSVALNSRSAAEGSTIEEFAIPLEPGWLVAGSNLLAVHGLNAAPDDPDLLMDFGLDGVGPPGEAPLYYEVPTPGAANATGFPGITGQVAPSVSRGLYYAPVTVSLSTSTPGAQIRYTLDGSAPTAS